MSLKQYVLSTGERCVGFINYYRSIWNTLDFIFLVLVLFEGVCICVEEFHQSILLISSLMALRLLRICRLLRRFRYCYTLVTYFPRLYENSVASKIYEIGKIKNRQYLINLGLPAYSKVNRAINTYTGRTFIFYNETLVIEVDELNRERKSTKYIHEMFPGIPAGIYNVFRYIDENIYFFKHSVVYQFNEFQGTFIKAEKFSLDTTFGVPCQSKGLLEQLKELLSMMLANKIILSENGDDDNDDEDDV
ncbi:hypothetical protein HHI36_008064 [Cryptolaemus montrouzieri]|uniref:Ion transport domain-containing protein n=1 Tax=Cryptolaemus montrouzieri TaxID=559131 RepID=A0ABD2MRK9_9CUCU